MASPSVSRGAKGLFAPDSLAHAIFRIDELRAILSPVRCPCSKSRALLSLGEAAAALERRFLGGGQPPSDGLSAGIFEELRSLVASADVLAPLSGTPESRLVASLAQPEDVLSEPPTLALVREVLRAAPRTGVVAEQGRGVAETGCPAAEKGWGDAEEVWSVAELIASLLRGEGRFEAAGLIALSMYEERGLAVSLPRVLAITHRRARVHFWLGLVRAALRLDRQADVSMLLAAAPGTFAAERGRLSIAATLAARGRRREARLELASLSNPLLAPAATLLRARMDLDAGLVSRARHRVDTLPKTLHAPARALLAGRTPRLEDEPEPLARACAAEAMILRYQLGRIDPATPAGRAAVSAWIDDPRVYLALFPAWDGDRGPERLIAEAPKRARAGLHDHHRSAFVCAHAADIAARAPLLTGTLAEVRAAAAPSAGGALSMGALAPLESARRDLGGATSPARTFFDEGLSMTPRRERKRTALVEACKAALSALLADVRQPAMAVEMTASRRRVLLRLRGDRAAAALLAVLRRAPWRGPVPRLPLLTALGDLSPRKALDLFAEMPPLLAADIRPIRQLAESIEDHRLLVPETSALLQRAHDHLLLRFPSRVMDWLASFVRAFVDGLGAPPGKPAFERLLALDRAALPEDPTTLVAAWIAERDALVKHPLRRFIRSLTEPALATLVSTHALSFGRQPPKWIDADWRDLLGRLRTEIRGVARAPLRALSAALGERRDALRHLAQGAPPTPPLERDVALDERGMFTLRWLDKRRDAIAFLRFADSVFCCYHSDSALYIDVHDRRDTQFMILSLYRDPLSFCFQVRRSTGPLVEPFGFVFGSFAVCEGRPAVMLNGVYLRRQSQRLRFSVVRAIEHHLCAPLGIRDVAVGCRFGGEGPLPPGYEAKPRRVRRLRALVDSSGLARHIYDDLSSRVNADIQTEPDTYWRTIEAAATA